MDPRQTFQLMMRRLVWTLSRLSMKEVGFDNATLAGITTLAIDTTAEVEDLSGKVAASYAAGKALAEKAKADGIETIVFDRGGYRYQGRVKAFAEGARAGGLKF